eukprot:s1483_g15.t1
MKLRMTWASNYVLCILACLMIGLPDDAVMVPKDELQRWFPEAPMDQINKLVVPKAMNADEVPFNRHFRKRIQKATAVVLNLSSGPNPKWWEKKMPPGVEIINIDLLPGQDLLHDGLFSYWFQVAKEKRISAYLAGPPCRTVSVLRMKDDNGPRMLHARTGEHRHIEHPEAWVLSFDVAGPFAAGRDHDRVHPRYILRANLTVPVLNELPFIDGWAPKGFKPSDPPDALADVELRDDDVNPFKGELPAPAEQPPLEEAAVPDQQDQQDPPDPQQPPPDEHAAQDPEGPDVVVAEVDADAVGEANLKSQVADLHQFKVVNVPLAVPLVNRRENVVLEATSVIYSKLRGLQLPINQIHTDRAKEFISRKWRQWWSARGVTLTTTPGDEHQQNGRVEPLIGGLKRDVRVVLKGASLGEECWPLALRHAQELKFRRALSQLRVNTPKLLPFGCKVLVRTKIWRQRAQPWKFPMVPALALGPTSSMSLSSNGHWVGVDEGKVGFRTTAVVKPAFHGHQGEGVLPLEDHGDDPGDHPPPDDDEMYSPSYAPDDGDQPAGDSAPQGIFDNDDASPAGRPARFDDDAAFDQQLMEEMEAEYDRLEACDRLRIMDEIEMDEGNPVIQPMAPPPRRRMRGKQSAPAAPLGAAGGESHLFVLQYGGGDAGDPDENGDLQELRYQQRLRVMEALKEYRVLEALNAHLQRGCQQLFKNELARLTAGLTQDGLTSMANVELKQIKAVSSQLNNHIDEALQEIQPEGDDIPLPLEQDVVRQTYVVGRHEILAEKAAWVDVVRQEVQSLESTGTVKQTTLAAATGQDQRPVEVIPGKLICARKAPSGRRKARIVACGNYSQAVSSSETSTGGVDAVSLRTVLAIGSQHRWAVGSLDVKSAFLKAPRRATTSRSTLIRPPQLAVSLGLISPDTLWEVTGALYGLAESPGDWTDHRDRELRALEGAVPEGRMWLQPTAESNL